MSQSYYEDAVAQIVKAGNRLDSMGLAPATSGNYSMRISENKMAITVSGAHKGMLSSDQVMVVDIITGKALEDKKPSAETLLHCVIYKLFPQINAVLHTHSIPCSVITRILANEGHLVLKGYEMLKAYPDIDTHDIAVKLPIFDNMQDMDILSRKIECYLEKNFKTPAYLIRSHGIYGWGETMKQAMQVIEATEMMLSCEMNIMQISQ